MKWGINTWWQTVTGLTAIAWSLLTLIALAGAVSYNPPNRGAPGRSSTVRDAGSRGCGLIALEPTLTHWGETLEPQPTFWVFISEADRTVDLTLTHETTDAVLYTATYSAMPAAGISHLPAPADAPPLAPDQPYRWTLSIDCPDESGTNPATTGVVMRRSPDLDLAQALTDAPPAERVALLANHGLWYDALTELGHLRLAQPDDADLQATWDSLLTHEFVQLPDLVDQPLTACCPLEKTTP